MGTNTVFLCKIDQSPVVLREKEKIGVFIHSLFIKIEPFRLSYYLFLINKET